MKSSDFTKGIYIIVFLVVIVGIAYMMTSRSNKCSEGFQDASALNLLHAEHIKSLSDISKYNIVTIVKKSAGGFSPLEVNPSSVGNVKDVKMGNPVTGVPNAASLWVPVKLTEGSYAFESVGTHSEMLTLNNDRKGYNQLVTKPHLGRLGRWKVTESSGSMNEFTLKSVHGNVYISSDATGRITVKSGEDSTTNFTMYGVKSKSNHFDPRVPISNTSTIHILVDAPYPPGPGKTAEITYAPEGLICMESKDVDGSEEYISNFSVDGNANTITSGSTVIVNKESGNWEKSAKLKSWVIRKAPVGPGLSAQVFAEGSTITTSNIQPEKVLAAHYYSKTEILKVTPLIKNMSSSLLVNDSTMGTKKGGSESNKLIVHSYTTMAGGPGSQSQDQSRTLDERSQYIGYQSQNLSQSPLATAAGGGVMQGTASATANAQVQIAEANAKARIEIAKAEARARVAEAEARTILAQEKSAGRTTTAQSMLATTQSSPDAHIETYNYFTKNNLPLIYYGPGGSTAKILLVNSKLAITVTYSNGTTQTFAAQDVSSLTTTTPSIQMAAESVLPTLPSEMANTKFYDANGNYARIFMAKNGQYVIAVTRTDGLDIIFTTTNIYTYDTNNSRSFVIGKTTDGTTTVSDLDRDNSSLIDRLNNNSINNSQSAINTAYNTDGIPANKIPPGQQDLYILKSEIVPPVCPRCPQACGSKKKDCPPCPACARCPPSESNFSCQKVPDYSKSTGNICDKGANDGSCSSTDKYSQYRHNKKFQPVPMVADFSQF
tara:strand:+ start:3387 stop:5708 length:2322 start_codon:yes stop_codon:yes gene_type:complete